MIFKKQGQGSNSFTLDFRRPIYEELKQGSPPPIPPSRYQSYRQGTLLYYYLCL